MNTVKSIKMVAIAVVMAAVAAVVHGQTASGVCQCRIPNGPPNPHPYLVGYLGVYKNLDWMAVARTLDFNKMTHLNLAFINPPLCGGPCSAQSDMTLGGNRSFTDDALKAVVDAAHAHGTKVLISIGGDGGDRNIMQFYNAGLSAQLIEAIDAYLKKHGLDGVDVDVEEPKQMGVPFTSFVTALVNKLRPQGKLVTAAVAQYIQAGAQDDVLPLFDIVNVMIYGTYERTVSDMAYWSLANYPNAWAVDSVGGGTYRDGAVFTYQGETTVARETQLSRQYGGAMVWELTQDDPSSPHSLLKAIQRNLDPNAPPVPEPAPRRGGDN